MSYTHTGTISKSKLNDLPEKDLSCVPPNKNLTNIRQNSLPSSSNLILNNRTNEFLSTLPETSRLFTSYTSTPNIQNSYLPQTPPIYHNHLYSTHLNQQTNYSERFASNFNHLSINDNKLYNPSVTPILGNNSSSNHLSSNDLINEAILRRDNEIERLKMRLHLFEQQQLQSKQNSNILLTSKQQDPVEMSIKNFEFQSALIRDQISNYSTNKQAVNDLEILLNQREYEIQELKVKYTDDINKLEKDLIKYKNLFNGKEEELIQEKAKSYNLQKEIDKLNSKLSECNKYISELPTKDEVNQSEKSMNEVKLENENLKQKLVDFEKRINKAKLFIKEKNVELNDMKDKLEKSQLETNKARLEYENYKHETQSVGELIEKCEQNASLKADLECARKLLISLQEKLKQQEYKHQEKINELNDTFLNEKNLNQELNTELRNKDNSICKLEKLLKESSKNIESLDNEILSLNEKIKTFETVLNADSLKLLKLLFKELNMTTYDLELVVDNCINIYDNKPIDICSLLGTASQNSYDVLDLSQNDAVLNLVNSDYMHKKITELKELRKKLDNIKKTITDEYAEKIGNNISCITQ